MDDLEHVVKETATYVYQQISPELEKVTTILQNTRVYQKVPRLDL
jgi:hypothetical protein